MKKFIIPVLALTPMFAFAQEKLTNVAALLRSVGTLVDTALPIVMGLALLGFFWGLAKFVFNNGNEDAKKDGQRIMIWGVVALFVMVAVWGLVNFIGTAVGVTERGGSAPVPKVQNLQ